jgi:hypothetical protein
MSYMFSGTAFNGDISEWDVSSVISNGLNVRWSYNVQWRYFQMGCLFRHQHGIYVL